MRAYVPFGGGAVLPAFTQSGVLPPYHPGLGPTVGAGRSPYLATPDELVARFATTAQRNALLRSFFAYRHGLRIIGIDSGFQWVDGSFVEDVESLQARPPGDIDVVTFFARPAGTEALEDWQVFVEQNIDALRPMDGGIHAFLVDLTINPEAIVSQSAYWYGLFSHQRESHLWKGMVAVNLDADDTNAVLTLGGLSYAEQTAA